MMTRRLIATTTLILLTALLTVTNSSAFNVQVSPKLKQHAAAANTLGRRQSNHQSYQTSLTPPGNSALYASSLHNDENLEKLKRAGTIARKVAKTAGNVAWNGFGEGIKVGKKALQGLSQSTQVQTGIDRVKNFIGERRNDKHVQQGLERIRSVVDEAKSIFEEAAQRLRDFQTTIDDTAKLESNALDNEEFDREDEELFNNIPPKRPEVIVDAEVLEGIRVVGGTTNRKIVDAEVISKTWSR